MADNDVAATLAALTKMIELQQQQISQLQNHNSTHREIALIPKLYKAEDLNS